MKYPEYCDMYGMGYIVNINDNLLLSNYGHFTCENESPVTILVVVKINNKVCKILNSSRPVSINSHSVLIKFFADVQKNNYMGMSRMTCIIHYGTIWILHKTQYHSKDHQQVVILLNSSCQFPCFLWETRVNSDLAYRTSTQPCFLIGKVCPKSSVCFLRMEFGLVPGILCYIAEIANKRYCSFLKVITVVLTKLS